MTGAVVLLSGCFLVLCLLLLSLNLRSTWRWWIKAGAIVLTATFVLLFFAGLERLLGWPTGAPPPARFTLHAAVVHEPARRTGAPQGGAIYLWLQPESSAAATLAPPRAHVLPYSRALHEQVARAREQMQAGDRVEGRAAPAANRSGSRQIELYEAPPGAPPAKDDAAGRS